ncbi:hypothetical protein ACFL5Z_18750 [Planctomycetota bacterium]
MLDNAEYFGEGKTKKQNAAQIPIAYDRTMLEGGAGTHVLFLDFSVRMLNRKKLNELGIYPQATRSAKSSLDNKPKEWGISKVYDVSDLLWTCLKPNELIRRITEHVEPDSWYDLDETGHGTITPYPREQPNKLTVFQTPENHEKIERLLEEIRRSLDEQEKAKSRILMETRILMVSDAFMKYIGLDPNSVAGSKDWSDYLVHTSGESASFIVDQLHADLIIKATGLHKDSQTIIEPIAPCRRFPSAGWGQCLRWLE